MKLSAVFFIVMLVMGCTSTTKNTPCTLQGGVEEPTYPPYAWVSPHGSKLWYPAGQCRTDEEIGQHGH